EVISAAARILVVPDITGPRVVSASVGRSLREVFFTFNEALKLPAATALGNYRVTGQVVTNVILQPSGAGTVVSLAGRLTPGANIQITLSNLTDLLSHPLSLSGQTLSIHAPEITAGFATEDLYYCLLGGQLTDLASSPKYPNFPDEVNYVPWMEGPAFYTDA